MALAMNTTLTVSCETSEEETGPTLVHSTGVQNYRIQPELIRLLQESCTNEKLSDHDKGVQCSDPPAHIVDVFKRAGFSVTSESTGGSRKLWMLTKTGGSDSGEPSKPPGPPSKGGDKPKPKPAEEEEEEPAEEEEEEEEK
jgi:hypothetical protein